MSSPYHVCTGCAPYYTMPPRERAPSLPWRAYVGCAGLPPTAQQTLAVNHTFCCELLAESDKYPIRLSQLLLQKLHQLVLNDLFRMGAVGCAIIQCACYAVQGAGTPALSEHHADSSASGHSA
eukprot:6181652-Pleurochrysis_carterae.AAC.1